MKVHPKYVLIATPLGKGGMGGIDRIMDEVRNISTHHKDMRVNISFGTTRGRGSLFLSPFYLFMFLVRMMFLRIVGRMDVLHINLSSHGSARRKIIVAKCARLLKTPYVIHLHGSRFQQFFSECEIVQKQAIIRMFSRASKIVVLGQVWERFVAELSPEAKSRIVIIPNATPIPLLVPAADVNGTLRILFLGRLGARKGVPELVDALSMIAQNHTWHATIAGDGEIEQTRLKIDRLGLTDRVTLPGWVGPTEVAELLSRSDVLVLPSYNENLPMSVIEGMAAGLAVIATPVGAVEDIIIDGETGLLVPVGDAGAIADAIRSLIDDPEKRMALGRNARKLHAEKLEIGMYFDRLVDLWTGKNVK